VLPYICHSCVKAKIAGSFGRLRFAYPVKQGLQTNRQKGSNCKFELAREVFFCGCYRLLRHRLAEQVARARNKDFFSRKMPNTRKARLKSGALF
jgi:hypothetical protein